MKYNKVCYSMFNLALLIAVEAFRIGGVHVLDPLGLHLQEFCLECNLENGYFGVSLEGCVSCSWREMSV